MGARKLTVKNPEEIVENMPEKQPVGRQRRIAEYRADREAEKERQRARRAPLPPTEHRPYPGYVSPQDMFPEWDFEKDPLGPPLDDPMVATYCDMQWKAFNRYAAKLRKQEQA